MPRLTPHGHANLPIGESALFHEFRANQEIGVPGGVATQGRLVGCSLHH